MKKEEREEKEVQAWMFPPSEVEKARQQIITDLKRRKKSTQWVRDLRRLGRVIASKQAARKSH